MSRSKPTDTQQALHQHTVADLIKRLRKMHGHLSAKDRETVAMAIGAATDLALQLDASRRAHTTALTQLDRALQALRDQPEGVPMSENVHARFSQA